MSGSPGGEGISHVAGCYTCHTSWLRHSGGSIGAVAPVNGNSGHGAAAVKAAPGPAAAAVADFFFHPARANNKPNRHHSADVLEDNWKSAESQVLFLGDWYFICRERYNPSSSFSLSLFFLKAKRPIANGGNLSNTEAATSLPRSFNLITFSLVFCFFFSFFVFY